MDKKTLRTLARGMGATVERADNKSDWMKFATEKQLLAFREKIPFGSAYTGVSNNRYLLTVQYDRLRFELNPANLLRSVRVVIQANHAAFPMSLREDIYNFLKENPE